MQIGPRIRVGGSLGHAGQQIKQHVLPSTGGMIGSTLGPLGAVAGSMIDAKSSGKDSTAYLKGDLIKGARNAAVIGGGMALAGAHGAAAGGGGLLGTAKKIVTGPGGVLVDAAKRVFGGDRGGVLDKLLLGAGIASSAADQKRKQDMQGRAERYAVDSYNARAPMRTQGQAMALHPTTPHLDDIFSDRGNVYDDQKRGVVGPKVPVRSLSY